MIEMATNMNSANIGAQKIEIQASKKNYKHPPHIPFPLSISVHPYNSSKNGMR